MAQDNYQRVVAPESAVSRACPKCGHVAQAFSPFCPQCGAKVAKTGPKKWYRQPWFKILTFLFLTPLWVLIVLSDPDERGSVKFVAALVFIAYIVLIIAAVAGISTISLTTVSSDITPNLRSSRPGAQTATQTKVFIRGMSNEANAARKALENADCLVAATRQAEAGIILDADLMSKKSLDPEAYVRGLDKRFCQERTEPLKTLEDIRREAEARLKDARVK